MQNLYMHQLKLIFWRQFRMYKSKIKEFVIDDLFLWPLIFAVGSCYLAPLMYFGPGFERKAMMLYTGNILLQLLILGFNQASDLLDDRVGNKVFEYQRIGAPLWLLIIGRILFATLMMFLLTLPLLPMTKLYIGDVCYTKEVLWGEYTFILFLSSFVMASYSFFTSSFINGFHQLEDLWMRSNEPLLWLGGFWNPWYIMAGIFPLVGFFTRFNPLLYISEGLRQTTVPGPEFFPLLHSMCFLVLFGIGLCFGTYFLLKRRFDSI